MSPAPRPHTIICPVDAVIESDESDVDDPEATCKVPTLVTPVYETVLAAHHDDAMVAVTAVADVEVTPDLR
jgi:hypothetical protein